MKKEITKASELFNLMSDMTSVYKLSNIVPFNKENKISKDINNIPIRFDLEEFYENNADKVFADLISRTGYMNECTIFSDYPFTIEMIFMMQIQLSKCTDFCSRIVYSELRDNSKLVETFQANSDGLIQELEQRKIYSFNYILRNSILYNANDLNYILKNIESKSLGSLLGSKSSFINSISSFQYVPLEECTPEIKSILTTPFSMKGLYEYYSEKIKVIDSFGMIESMTSESFGFLEYLTKVNDSFKINKFDPIILSDVFKKIHTIPTIAKTFDINSLIKLNRFLYDYVLNK